METLTNIVDRYFMERQWNCSKVNEQNEQNKQNKSNRVCYNNTNQITNPYDDFIIEYLTLTNQYDIIVPIGSVPYKKRFTDETITRVADYIKMHLDYYYDKKQL